MLMSPDRLMSDMLDFVRQDFDRMLGGPRGLARVPAANLWETSDALVVEMELPGVTEENVDIQVTNEELAVRGRRQVHTPENANAHRRERMGGEFERVFGLPFPVDAEKVEATLRDGVLTIRLPKAETALPRKIAVRNG